MTNDPKIIYDFNPHNIPDEYHKAIGLVALCASQTETILGEFIASLLGIDAIEGMAVTTHLGNPSKDQICRTLIELNAVAANIVDDVDDLLDRIRLAQSKRNVIIHNSLAIHPITKAVYSFRPSARGSTQVALVEIPISEISEVAIELYEAGMELMNFMAIHNISPADRTRPVHAPLNRKRTAREKRREHLLSLKKP